MEVLPAFVILAAAVVWLWLRDSGKQVASDAPHREGSDAPSPRSAEGHSGHLQLAWRDPTAATPGLAVLHPDTGQPIDEGRVRLESEAFEVVEVVDVDPAARHRGDVEPGVVLLVQRAVAPSGSEVEFRTADTGEQVGRLAPQRASQIASLMEAGRRLESMVVRHQARSSRSDLHVLVAERGVLPPVPDQPRARDSG